MEATTSTAEIVFGNRLVPRHLEDLLFRFEKECPNTAEFQENATRYLHIDLSKVGWADLGAVAQLILFIKRQADSYGSVLVVMPKIGPLPDDSHISAINDRRRVCKFLEYIRFPECISAISVESAGSVILKHDSDPAQKYGDSHGDQPSYLRVVPLLWLSLGDIKTRSLFSEHIARALSNAGLGLDVVDANALSNVALHELVENVDDHVGKGARALVCGFVHSKDQVVFTDDFMPEERSFLTAAQQNSHYFIELIVGDSGPGIDRMLSNSYVKAWGDKRRKAKEPAPFSVVRWAFDRWSSGKPFDPARRGVRGLYRVDRIAAKYQGQIVVRAGKALVTRDHAIYGKIIEKVRVDTATLAAFPGSFIRLRLLPKHSLTLRLGTDIDMAEKKSNLKDLFEYRGLKTVFIDKLDANGVDRADKEKIVSLLGDTPERPEVLLVLVGESNYAKHSVERLIEFLSENGAPVPIFALNVPGSDVELSISIDSINAQFAGVSKSPQKHASRVERMDPICIVSSRGTVFWTCVPENASSLLSRLMTGRVHEFPDVESQSAFLSATRSISGALKVFVPVGGSRKTSVCASHPVSEIINNIALELSQTLQSSKRETGVWRDSTYLTPTLQYVHTWFEIDTVLALLSRESLTSLAFALSVKIRSKIGSTSQASLYSTPSSSQLIRNALVNALGLFNEVELNANVIGSGDAAVKRIQPILVYTDIISTQEAAREAAQHAIKAGRRVLAVACLVDARAVPYAEIQVLGEQIPLISLLHFSTECPAVPDATPISPSLRWVETDDPAIASRDQNKPIDPLLTQDSPVSIVFGHRPSHNGRHLTLTVDVNSLLGDPRLIGFVRSHINRFFGDDDPKIGTIPVWIPVDSRAQVSWKDVAVDLFKAAASKVSVEISFITRFAFAGETIFDQSRVGAERVRKARSLVIFDWGAITGTTIHQLVNVGAMLGADRILVLIASNQLSAHEIAFHNSIDGLGVKRLKKSTDLFASAEFVYSSVEVKFEQFSTTSLGRFAELDCPVCKQIIEISNLVSADSFLENYKVEEAIRLNKYALNPDGTQGTADRLLGIAIFRDLVDRSRLSTSLRKQVLDRLVEIAAFDVSRRSHQSQAFPVIELLYLESHWLKLPPLKYKVCRANLASICIKLIVAGDEAVQAVCLSVLRRISKTEFVAQCANLFLKLPSRWIAQQTLLAGLHSYILNP